MSSLFMMLLTIALAVENMDFTTGGSGCSKSRSMLITLESKYVPCKIMFAHLSFLIHACISQIHTARM